MFYNKENIRQLIMERLSGVIDPADEQLLQQAIEEDEQVRQMWQELHATIGSPAMQAAWERVNIDGSWERLRQKRRPAPARSLPPGRWMAAAAIMIAAMAAAYLIWMKPAPVQHVQQPGHQGIRLQLADGSVVDLSDSSAQTVQTGNTNLQITDTSLSYTTRATGSTALNTLSVPPKKDYKLVLSEGTEVWLNATSSLRFPFSFNSSKREVYLEGEAYFNVTRKNGQPFIVHTPQIDIEVLGTSFNVNTFRDGMTTTALVTGAVRVQAGAGQHNSLVLKPGFEAVFKPDSGFAVQAFNEKQALGWMRGDYLFHDTPLQEIARVITRWYDIPVVFDHAAVAAERFTGILQKDKSVEELLQGLKTTTNTESYWKGEELHFK